MAHVVNFSPLPSEAIAARLDELDIRVVSVRDVDDDLAACDGAVVAIADFSGERVIGPRHIEVLAPTCRLVAVPSAGLDAVDVEACRARSLPVASSRGLNAGPVAEWAVWATIGAMRGLSDRDTGIRDGRWEQFGARYELSGKQVGIIGMGPIGEGIARRLRSFDVECLYWTRTRRRASVESRLGISWRDLDDLVAEADAVVLAIAVGDATRGLVDGRRIGLMRPTSVLVNAGRADLVDQAEVLRALEDGRLHGYATDVFTEEPPHADDPLPRQATIATPHLAGVTVESVQRITGRMFENVNRVLAGHEPHGLV